MRVVSLEEALSKHFPYRVDIPNFRNEGIGIFWLRKNYGIEANWRPRQSDGYEIYFKNEASCWDFLNSQDHTATIFFFRSDKDAVEFKMRFG